MPNTKSAIRRVRRVKKQTQINRIRRSKYKNAVKKKYNISRVQLPLYRYRKHQENLTNDKNKMREYSEKISEKHKKEDEHVSNELDEKKNDENDELKEI